ncbi:hypothetical protein [Pseudogemmobacter humi]|uniref:Uncharacterized protein n=1 Tax=Pseudogemmobacter humi TaxID=2483812 RepID=A0A3P5X295_9RHOB|nr:hypothetical protein [Pseudogemmobacter humi]VDC28249.1 hypothetical protein XINFAN_02024 [Pseudogemmobacter humi]
MTTPNFTLGEHVSITCSGETGQVIGHAIYLTSSTQCLVRYRAANGRAVEKWWNVEALSAADAPPAAG